MSSISENLVREYFEINNFAVKINKKYAFSTKKRKDIEEINLIVSNLKAYSPSNQTTNFILNTNSLKTIGKAIVEVKGWHSEKFTPSVLINATPLIFKFVDKKVLAAACDLFGTAEFKTILVIPALPKPKETRKKSIMIMQEKGINHVLEFKTILDYIIESVNINKNYTESDILQTIRLLKNYNLFKDSQLELFKQK